MSIIIIINQGIEILVRVGSTRKKEPALVIC